MPFRILWMQTTCALELLKPCTPRPSLNLSLSQCPHLCPKPLDYRHHGAGRQLPGGVPVEKGYQVHGIKRRASSFNTSRIDHLYQDPHETSEEGQAPQLTLHYGDLTDSSNLIRIIQQVQPDEIYNLGAQSHVAVSFESPEYTANCDALGMLRILESVRILGLTDKTRIYQASTSELYGLVQETPQKESTQFIPAVLMG